MANNTRKRTDTQEKIDKEIGARIKQRIKDLHLSVPKIADEGNFREDTLYGYTSGRISLPANKVDKLCSLLDCDANYLIIGNDDLKRKSGLDENACRMLTSVDEWKILNRDSGKSI